MLRMLFTCSPTNALVHTLRARHIHTICPEQSTDLRLFLRTISPPQPMNSMRIRYVLTRLCLDNPYGQTYMMNTFSTCHHSHPRLYIHSALLNCSLSYFRIFPSARSLSASRFFRHFHFHLPLFFLLRHCLLHKDLALTITTTTPLFHHQHLHESPLSMPLSALHDLLQPTLHSSHNLIHVP